MFKLLLITLIIQFGAHASESESENSAPLQIIDPDAAIFNSNVAKSRFDERTSEIEQAKNRYIRGRLGVITDLEVFNHSADSKINPRAEKLKDISDTMADLVQLRKEHNLANPACECPERCSLTPKRYYSTTFAGMASWLSIPLCFIALSPVCAQPIEGTILWTCLACEASGCLGLGVCWKCSDRVYNSCIMPCMLPAIDA
jgi:hypothetical protein